jgi:outer membrane protein insertion porin family
MRDFHKIATGIILFFALFFIKSACFAIEDLQAPVLEAPRALSEEEKESGLPYIESVEIIGNNLVPDDVILDQMSLKSGYAYDKTAVVKDLNNIYKLGFFTRKIKALPIRNDKNNNIVLRVIVEENPPITGFTLSGNTVLAQGELLNILQPLEGMPQNIMTINSAIEQIQELYSIKGYILARVVAVQDDPDGVVNLKVDEGVIEDVVVNGNNKTKDFIVKRNISLEPGTIYNENTTRNDILRLMGTQAYGDVTRDIQMDPETGQYVITVNLEEQRTGKVSLGVGVDSSSGFFGSVGFEENNFRGLGQKLGLNFMAGTGVLMSDQSVLRRANYQAEVTFLEPYFRDKDTALGLRSYFRSFGSYQVPLAIENRFGGEATLSRRFKTFKNLSGSVAFGGEYVNMAEGDEDKIRSLYGQHNIPWSERDEQLKGGFFVKLTPSLVYDTRDNPMNPRHGGIAKISLEEGVNLTDFGYSYGKLTGILRKFIPAGRKSSVVLTARAGGNINGKLPEFASYTLGGPYTIRGFNISEVGTGDGFMLGSAEFRTPIPFIDRLTSNTFINNIKIAAFVDAGKIFSPTITDTLYDRPGYAISAGVGLRVFVPGLGPINLDYGLPLTNTAGVERSQGFFTFGMGDML